MNTIIYLLGFEDKEEAAAWCQCHNLPVDEHSDTIALERTTFVETPEKFPNKRRSFQLIENKRTCPVSQIIANGRVPLDQALSNHQPHNSFDQNGILYRHSWLADDQTVEKVVSYEPAQNALVVTEQPHSLVSSFVRETVTSTIFNQVIDSTVGELLFQLAQEVQREQHNIFKLTKFYYESFIRDFTR